MFDRALYAQIEFLAITHANRGNIQDFNGSFREPSSFNADNCLQLSTLGEGCTIETIHSFGGSFAENRRTVETSRLKEQNNLNMLSYTMARLPYCFIIQK